jgi:plastocyanin
VSLKHGLNLSLLVAFCVVLLLGAAGCEKKSDAPPPAPPGGGTAETASTSGGGGGSGGGAKGKIDPATVENPGTIKGVVKFEGTVPPLGTVNMQQKPECSKLHGDAPPKENIVVGPGGGLRDVFVHVTKGLEGYSFDPPSEPAMIDQKGCVYIPHVFGIMVGQDVKLINSDAFLHNVKVTDNRPLNEAMPNVGDVVKKKWFKKTGIPTSFQCEVHPWMKAYACVVDHPYHSVTTKDGAFEIKGLPAGTYTISVWHELFPGLKAVADQQEVTVGAGETKDLEFTYKIGG